VIESKKDSEEATKKMKSLAIPAELRIHRLCGYALAVIFGVHVFATRVVPMVYDLKVEYSLLTNGLRDVPYIFYIYYPILGMSGFYHMFYGLHRAFGVLGMKLFPAGWGPGTSKFRTVATIGCVVMFSSILAIGGNYFHVEIPQRERLLEIQEDVNSRLLHLIGL
jgi:hypothetical protein